LYIC